MISIDDAVRLETPADPVHHGLLGTVVEVTDFGAVVSVPVLQFGGGRTDRWEMRYRALAAELVPLGGAAAGARALPPARRDGTHRAREEGYTGDACVKCGSMKVKRNGACLLCCECGETTGCS